MKANTAIALLLAFLIVFLAVGIPYWQVPYSRVSLPSTLYGLGLALAFVASATLRLGTDAKFMQVLTVVGLTVPAAVMARVGVETAQDPTSHNLWPFEIIIAAGVGFAVALAGGVLGAVLRSFLKKGVADESGG